MSKPGRQSQADLSTAAVNLPQRPQPPDSLSQDEKGVWREVVNGMDVDWFQPEQHEILANYCRAVVIARNWHKIVDLHDQVDVREFKACCDAFHSATKTVRDHARDMRITHHARYDTKKASRKNDSGRRRSPLG